MTFIDVLYIRVTDYILTHCVNSQLAHDNSIVIRQFFWSHVVDSPLTGTSDFLEHDEENRDVLVALTCSTVSIYFTIDNYLALPACVFSGKNSTVLSRLTHFRSFVQTNITLSSVLIWSDLPMNCLSNYFTLNVLANLDRAFPTTIFEVTVLNPPYVPAAVKPLTLRSW